MLVNQKGLTAHSLAERCKWSARKDANGPLGSLECSGPADAAVRRAVRVAVQKSSQVQIQVAHERDSLLSVVGQSGCL